MWSWRSKTLNELPALSIRRDELRRSLRVVTVAWMYGCVWMSCVSGSHVKVFASMFGFTNLDFGVMTALPYIATFGQLLASVIIERTGFTKYQFIYCASMHRLLWIVVGLLPLVLPVPSRVAVWSLLIVLFMSWFMAALHTPAWWTWMGDLIPRQVRGRYFANRQVYARPIQVAVAIALGVVLDCATGGGDESAVNQPFLLHVICGIFVVAGLFGLADILSFLRIREVVRRRPGALPPPVPSVAQGAGAAAAPDAAGASASALGRGAAGVRALWDLLASPMKDRVFFHYVGYSATITFAMAAPSWFLWRYGMETLHFSKLAINFLFLVISPVLGLIGAQWWGKAIDRWGRRPVLVVATLMTTVSVSPWFFAMPSTPAPHFVIVAANWVLHGVGALVHRPDWLTLGDGAPVGAYLLASIASVVGGIAWTGISLAQTAVILGFSDGKGRSRHMAVAAVLTSLGGALGGLAGGNLAEMLQDHALQVGPFLWNNWHATFALSLLARIVSLAWLVHMPDPGSRHVKEMVRYFGQSVFDFAFSWVFFPLRLLGLGRKDGDDDQEK